MILITPFPGVTTLKPGSATKPFPGVERGRRRRVGKEVGTGGGNLVLRAPGRRCFAASTATRSATARPTGRGTRACTSPATVRGSTTTGLLAARPGRRRDERLRPPDLDDRGRVGARRPSGGRRGRGLRRSDATTGQAIVAYVTLKAATRAPSRCSRSCATTSRSKIGAIASRRTSSSRPELPKTRSGKIMRRLLRDVAENRELGDTTTLADPAVVEEIRERALVGAGQE